MTKKELEDKIEEYKDIIQDTELEPHVRKYYIIERQELIKELNRMKDTSQ